MVLTGVNPANLLTHDLESDVLQLHAQQPSTVPDPLAVWRAILT